MALEFEDRILGEKVDYYCDSSDDERHEKDENGSDEESAVNENPPVEEPQNSNHHVGFSAPPRNHANTGPKGVMEDYRQFKLMEKQKRDHQEMEIMHLANKLSITCNSHAEDRQINEALEDWERELEEMLESDEFIEEYRQKRFQEMLSMSEELPTYGKVYTLNILDFLENVESEPKNVHVIVHIYENDNAACDAIQGCFLCLCKEYLHVKFCRILSSEANLSEKFARDGVPALILFKGGKQMKNLVAVGRELGQDFFASDLESYLVSHGLIPSIEVDLPHYKRGTIQSSTVQEDSDYDVD